MSKQISLLRKAEEVQLSPFPHIVIDNALPEDIYSELLKTRPSSDFILQGRSSEPNKRYDLSAGQCLGFGVPAIWQKFIEYHISNEWWLEVYSLFADCIDMVYPSLRLSGILDIEPGIRRATKKPFFLDCNIGINTPCTELSSVRGPHLDNPVELFAGLLYMGEGEGGNLVVNKLIKPLRFYGKMEIEEDCVEETGIVPYRHNQFVMFLNTPLSVHSVTPRNSEDCRNLVNVIGEFSFPLFNVERR